MRALLSQEMTLGALSFGVWKPAGLRVRLTNTGDVSLVFKGRRFGRDNSYVLSTPFEVVDSDSAGVRGVSHAVGSFERGAFVVARCVLCCIVLCCATGSALIQNMHIKSSTERFLTRHSRLYGSRRGRRT